MKRYPVTNIQRFSTQDGPGIRTTVFFKGCPLQCEWCHNPETQSYLPQIFYTEQYCIGCGECISVCQNHAHYKDENVLHRFDVENCTGCLTCVAVCPSKAIEPVSQDMTTDEIMNVVLKDKAFYGDVGGITLSGGEPLIYGECCTELLSTAKKQGITTVIETSGYFDGAIISEIVPLTDLFLWDFKDGNPVRHKLYTGVSNEKILKNLFLVDEYQTRILLRCVMVNGVNMDDENFNQIALVTSQLKHCIGVELLPYHAYGGSKNKQLGFNDNGRTDWIPSGEDLKKAKEKLQSYGVKVI